ncbi:MAG: hypothetical protein ABI831_22530 [Betaproteobacteria bacterium]
MSDGDDPIQVIVASLLAYLTAHPDAADSIEGIRRWWLPSHTHARTPDMEAALERLVRMGELTPRQLPDGGVLYARRNH